MTKRVFGFIMCLAVVGCGDKAQEFKNAASAIKAASEAGSNFADNQKEAEKFYAERKAKGDTIAIPYADLQKFLPSPPSGYTADAEPSGSSQSMGAFSMSQAEQTYTMPADADGNAPTIHVAIVDFGGTEAAYGLMALPMMMNMSQEDAHHRMQTLKLDAPYTWGSEEYNKDDKTAKVTLITRYRYVITVEARNQGEDKTAMAKSMAEDIAKQFAGK